MTYTWTIDLTIPTVRSKHDIIGLVVGSDADDCVDLNDSTLEMSDHDVLCMLAEALDLPKPYPSTR